MKYCLKNVKWIDCKNNFFISVNDIHVWVWSHVKYPWFCGLWVTLSQTSSPLQCVTILGGGGHTVSYGLRQGGGWSVTTLHRHTRIKTWIRKMIPLIWQFISENCHFLLAKKRMKQLKVSYYTSFLQERRMEAHYNCLMN